MFRQLKEMFRKEDVSTVALALGDIPGWLTEEYAKVRKTETDQVGLSRKNILGYIGHLRELVGFLGAAGHEGDVHPKLENVVEKSLPLYKKAIMSALNRQFPEAPDDFYFAATECLKGCLKSSAGPGRYLVGVFPEEMKSIRAVIDQVGREINAMNPVIAEARKKSIELDMIRDLHGSYLQTLEEFREAEGRHPLLKDRTMTLHGEIEVIEEEIRSLSMDPRKKQLDELRSGEKQLEEERERALGEFSSSVDMIAHVLKRAEKVARRDQKTSMAKKMHNLAEQLSKNEIPEISLLCQELNDILPGIIAMVTHGDISLRNKEEHHYFSNPTLLPGKMQEISVRIEYTVNQLNEIRRNIDESSIRREQESLDRRYRMKMSELAELERNMATLEGRITLLKEEVPSLLRKTEDQISLYSGKKTIILENAGEAR
jgi:hypothetical protein